MSKKSYQWFPEERIGRFAKEEEGDFSLYMSLNIHYNFFLKKVNQIKKKYKRSHKLIKPRTS